MAGMDQFDTPLVYQQLFGGRINQYGVSLHWMLPALIASSNELYLEVTNTDNGVLFGASDNHPEPSYLMHFVNYYTLSSSSYLTVGLSALAGKNNLYKEERDRWTKLFGIDLTYLYEPIGQAKYNSTLFRSEFFYEQKETLDGSDKKEITAYGMYAYVQTKLTEKYSIGIRYDYSVPLVLGNSGKYTNQVVPYLTYWQSPWVKMRFQYNYKKSATETKADHQLVGQLIFGMGPHKHERY